MRELQSENEKKLEEMRKTVDEKLHGTLEKRLGESFKLVSVVVTFRAVPSNLSGGENVIVYLMVSSLFTRTMEPYVLWWLYIEVW